MTGHVVNFVVVVLVILAAFFVDSYVGLSRTF